MAKIKVWKENDPKQPSFPEDFELLKKAVLQVTDIKTNRNKYYAVELHKGSGTFRVYTHYGRTDDLDTNPRAGMRECRYSESLGEAEKLYESIYNEKTSRRKGYQEVSLASAKIGSTKSIGKSSGYVDDETIKKMSIQEGKKKNKPQEKKITLHKSVHELVDLLYSEATNALTSTINATITANGIETPLGVLTIGQIDKGESILQRLYELNQKKKKTADVKDQIVDLSGQFYTVIPHRIGRSRAAAQASVIQTLQDFEAKQETLQLMRDMLNVSGDDASVLINPEIDKKYKALNCTIEACSAGENAEMSSYVEKSQVKSKGIKVKNIWRVSRPSEQKVFNTKVGNEKLLFHGSRGKNWVGILSRGLLMPKIVVSLGVNRTDAGWLGNGIYFGDAVCTTLTYTSPGKRKTRFMTVARVALGKEKQYKKITYGLNSPPAGFDSCHGLRRKGGNYSEFDDDEYVIYDEKQQKLEYLVEYTGGSYW